MLNTEGFKEFANIENDLEKAKAEVDRLKARKDEIWPDLLENLATEGFDSVKINGRTIYPHTRIVSKLKSRQDAVEALKEAAESGELESYVAENFNTVSLNALLAEMNLNGEKLPDAFEGRIAIDKVITLRSSKS